MFEQLRNHFPMALLVLFPFVRAKEDRRSPLHYSYLEKSDTHLGIDEFYA